MDAANLLKPALARGELRCIGATTLAEYRKHMEKDAAFERRFQQVMVDEPSVTDTINILRGLSERYSSYHGVRIADRALVVAAELSDRYITARFLPDKAIDLVDEACAALRVQLDSVPEDIDTLQRRITALQVRAPPRPPNLFPPCLPLLSMRRPMSQLKEHDSTSQKAHPDPCKPALDMFSPPLTCSF